MIKKGDRFEVILKITNTDNTKHTYEVEFENSKKRMLVMEDRLKDARQLPKEYNLEDKEWYWVRIFPDANFEARKYFEEKESFHHNGDWYSPNFYNEIGPKIERPE